MATKPKNGPTGLKKLKRNVLMKREAAVEKRGKANMAKGNEVKAFKLYKKADKIGEKRAALSRKASPTAPKSMDTVKGIKNEKMKQMSGVEDRYKKISESRLNETEGMKKAAPYMQAKPKMK